MLLLSLLAHLPALYGFYRQVPFWIKKDVAAFDADGSNDSKHFVFHRQRLLWRLGTSVALAVLGSLLLVVVDGPHWGAFFLSQLALLAAGGGYWVYAFNPGLNLARKLDYVPKYYVSFSPTAAYFPDRWLARRAYGRFPVLVATNDTNELARRTSAAWELQQVLRACLLAGLGGYAVLTALAAWVY